MEVAPAAGQTSPSALERNGSWSPKGRHQKRPRASDSDSQSTLSPHASSSHTTSRAAPGGPSGTAALHQLSVACHDALCADKEAACKRRAVIPNEQDSATSQAVAFTTWGQSDAAAAAQGKKSAEQQQQQQQVLPPAAPPAQRRPLTSSVSEEERLKCQEELATTRLLRGGPDIIPQTVFLEAIQQGQEATELFEFRWPRERQASRTSSILNLTQRQHGIMYALAGCGDVMYVMSRVKAEVRETLQRLYGVDKINFYTWFKNRRLPMKRLLDRHAARAANAARSGDPHAPSSLSPRQLGTHPAAPPSSQPSAATAVPVTTSMTPPQAAPKGSAAGGGSSATPSRLGLSDTRGSAEIPHGVADMTRASTDPASSEHTALTRAGDTVGQQQVVIVQAPRLLSQQAQQPQLVVMQAPGSQQVQLGQGLQGRLATALAANGKLQAPGAAVGAVPAGSAGEQLAVLLPPQSSTGASGNMSVAQMIAQAQAKGTLDGLALHSQHSQLVSDMGGRGGSGLQVLQLPSGWGGQQQVLTLGSGDGQVQVGGLGVNGLGVNGLGVNGLGVNGLGGNEQLLRLLSGGGGAGPQLAYVSQAPPVQQQLCITTSDGQMHLVSLPQQQQAPQLQVLQCQDLSMLLSGGGQQLGRPQQPRWVLQTAGGGMGMGGSAAPRGGVCMQQLAQQQQQRMVLQAGGAGGGSGLQLPLSLLQQQQLQYGGHKMLTTLPLMSLPGASASGNADVGFKREP